MQKHQLFLWQLLPAYCRLVALGIFIFLSASLVNAQTSNWRAEADSMQQVIRAVEDTTVRLAAEINTWKKQGTARLSGAQQTRWALRLASLNRGYQTLIAFSDRGERARRLMPKEFAKRYGVLAKENDEISARLAHLQFVADLLDADRAIYTITDSLRFAVGSSQTIKNRLNQGNRSFGIQYGIFAEMNAIYVDPQRNRRTRGRYLQLREQKNFIEANQDQARELSLQAKRLLQDATLQRLAAQSDVAVLFANSVTALGAVVDPAADLTTRTFFNLSQFFGNFVGTYLFKIGSVFGIGASRGHAVPAFHRYYPHPAGRKKGVHPAKVKEIARGLRAGDILFDKTRFAITDKLIPGYFGHVAIYLESYEALQELGVFDSATMRQATNGMTAAAIDAQIEAYAVELTAIPDQEEWVRLGIMRHRTFAKNFNPLLFEALYRLKYDRENVIEALRDGQGISGHEGGVTVNSLAHFLYVDDFAAMRLRPGNWSAAQYRQNLASFLALALLQYGKPYDFQFDVNTLDAIICSELIYQSFVDIDFKTGKSLASYTIAPDQVAQEGGIKTALDTLRLDPPFELLQWYADGVALYPARATANDTLPNRAFMAMVREEYGGLNLLTPLERKQYDDFYETAKRERAHESDSLSKLPAGEILVRSASTNKDERRRQNFYINLNRRLEQAAASGKSEAEIEQIKKREIEKFEQEESNERVQAVAADFKTWRSGAAYQPSYVDLYSGPARFWLSVFRSASLADDDGFGRGLDLQLAITNELPQPSRLYSQHYAFLPFYAQFFDRRGKSHKALQGGAMLARISRRFTQGDYIEMNALTWRNDAYATSLRPFTLEAGGDKGVLDAVLKLTTLGNGNYQRGFYFGESGGIEVLPYEARNHKRALTVANFYYGGRAQLTLGKLRWYATGKLGARLGNFYERKKQTRNTDFPPLRSWKFGLEFLHNTLYRPTGLRLEFEVSEDDARFIQGRLQKDRQARLSLRWSVHD